MLPGTAMGVGQVQAAATAAVSRQQVAPKVAARRVAPASRWVVPELLAEHRQRAGTLSGRPLSGSSLAPRSTLPISTISQTGLPNPSSGNHNQGQNCIQCHVSGSSTGAPTWLFGGTVYKTDGTTPAPNVQLGINDGTNLYTTYSATNGNIWLPASGTVNWAKAQVRIRDSNGESTMAGATPAATCNLCHSSTTYPRITAP